MTFNATLAHIDRTDRNMAVMRIVNHLTERDQSTDAFILASEWYLATVIVRKDQILIYALTQIKAQEVSEPQRMRRFSTLIDETLRLARDEGIYEAMLFDSVIAASDPYPRVVSVYRAVLQANDFVLDPYSGVWRYRQGDQSK